MASFRQVAVYDLRNDNCIEKEVNLPENADISHFRSLICSEFNIETNATFVISTTSREEIENDNSVDIIESGDTLYILTNIDQELPSQTKQKVDFLPHYDTIVKSGMYEYYDSEGQNPIPYAFAELIDNSLAATVNNIGLRNIELRLFLDDSNADKSAIFVIDNGCGMTSWQLNNWAIYRLSKFIRKEKIFKPIDNPELLSNETAPRSLNSEISYFGVGGKQAIFFMGNATRMITKSKESQDVHELCISKEQFEKKELNKEFVYSGEIRNRKPGDWSHLSNEDELLKKIIGEEVGKESFTCVTILGITANHIHYLKQFYPLWCTQLANIYHYYLHGPNGNTFGNKSRVCSPYKNIEININLHLKGCNSRSTSLRDLDDDMQTQFIRSAAKSFEFKAIVEDTKLVEGILRYHPFLYDHETYPTDPIEIFKEPEDDQSYLIHMYPARGRRAIFDCFWNGRLIPYSSVRDFDWCSVQKKSRNIPIECYNRISGVLWTNDAFQVSTNKLTFLDLENKLKDKSTMFTRVISGQDKRGSIEKQFTEWLQKCHQDCDKQIHFTNFQGHVTRTDLQKHRQFPWAVYNSIEWDGKEFVHGMLVRTQRTVPIILGRIRSFMLYGEHDGDVYATGGEFEIDQEPKAIYDEVRFFSLAKLDRKVTEVNLQKSMEVELEKLPARLEVTWPEGDQLFDNETRAAGKTIGAIKVQISNRRDEFINKLPGSQKKLLIELKVVWHSAKGDVIVSQFLCQHAKHWPYWFRKMENIKELGSHTLFLQAVLAEGETTLCGKALPSRKICFTVVEAAPISFSIGSLDGPFRIGMPFDIPLNFQDRYSNSAKPTANIKPRISANGLDIKYGSIVSSKNGLVVKGIVAKGSLDNSTGKNFSFTIKVPGLENESQTLKIRMLPGQVAKLIVKPDGEILEIENNSSPLFQLVVVDDSGNVTFEPRLHVSLKFQGIKDLPSYKADLSSSGKSQITGPPLCLKNMSGSELIVGRFEIPNRSNVEMVERHILVLPSRKAASLRVTYILEDGSKCDIEKDKDIMWTAGMRVTGLEYLVYDEGGRPIKITSSLASKLKVNWVSKGVKDTFLAGKLPDIETPNSIRQQLYCNISLAETDIIDFGFTIRPKPGEPETLKVSITGSNRIRLGEALQSDVLVNITDQNGNQIRNLSSKTSLSNLLITADELDYSDLEKGLGQNSSFVIKKIRFADHILGVKDVKIKYLNLEDMIRLEVVPGVPCKLSYPNYDPGEFVTLHSETKLPHSLVVQLCDSRLNPTSEPNIKVQLGIDEGLKINPSIHTVKTDSSGQAVFGNLTISVKPNQSSGKCPAQICLQNCRGIFSICAKAVCNRIPVMGPLLKLHIPFDPARPHKIHIEHNLSQEIRAGSELPEMQVSVLSEEGSVLKHIKTSQMTLRFWNNSLKGTPAKNSSNISPTEFRESTGIFYFRKLKAAVESGSYSYQFTYNGGNLVLSSDLIKLKVLASQASKLVPSHDPGTPAVSNTADVSNRCLVNNLRLQFHDEFNNIVDNDLNGSLNVQITSENGKGEIPRMLGNVTSIELPIRNGQVLLQTITIQENTPGIDGKEYVLKCTATIPKYPNLKIPPYRVPFLFCNDARKQQEIASLSKEKDSLFSTISAYRNIFETSKQMLRELKDAVKSAEDEEKKIKLQLKDHGFNAASVNTEVQIMGAIERVHMSRKKLERMKKRQFGMAPAPEEPQVLGKIGQLAYVKDENVANVLSWHMQSDMDCVVTHTMEKARELHKRLGGRMQLLPLDSIYRKNLPHWGRPLMHDKIRDYRPKGNPIYARDLLIFHKEPENCRIVFGMLLGDTIILDTLEDATHYREQLVKHMFCPTLLTRTGERIRSNGKFGGQQNKAPPIDRLRGLVFGEPPLKECDSFAQQIELLENLRPAILRHEKTKAELAQQLSEVSSLDAQEKAKALCDAEQKLKEIEKKIGIVKASTTKVKRNSVEPLRSNPTPKRRSAAAIASPPAQSETNGYNTPSTKHQPALRRKGTPPQQQLSPAAGSQRKRKKL